MLNVFRKQAEKRRQTSRKRVKKIFLANWTALLTNVPLNLWKTKRRKKSKREKTPLRSSRQMLRLSNKRKKFSKSRSPQPKQSNLSLSLSKLKPLLKSKSRTR